MALNLDPEERGRTLKIRAGAVGPARQVLRDGIEQLAHGALICPSCDAPLYIERPVPAGQALHCGYCDHLARARDFLIPDVYDTVANEVYPIARVVE